MVLQSGSNKANSRLRIAAEFVKGKPVSEIADFLRREYEGGKGFRTEPDDISVWFSDEGIRVYRFDTVRYVNDAQLMSGELTARESEGDGDFALSAAEIKAISSGNPLIMEQFEVAAELSKMETLERAHSKETAQARAMAAKARAEITAGKDFIANLKADLSSRTDTTGDKFTISIGQKTYSERKDAGEALVSEAKKRLKVSRDTETSEKIGTFAGFDLLVTNSGDLLLKGKNQYRSAVNMQSASGTVQALEAAAKRIDTMLSANEARLRENESAVGKYEKIADSTFDKSAELAELRKRNAEIMAELNPVEDLAPAEDDDSAFREAEKETDSEGNELTEEQADYFRNSAVRDGEGRLIPLYHGTGGDFFTFDSAYEGETFETKDTDRGFFFTTDAEKAEWAAQESAEVKGTGKKRMIRAYLDITNPFEVTMRGKEDPVQFYDENADGVQATAQDNDGILIWSSDHSELLAVAFSPEQIKAVDISRWCWGSWCPSVWP